MPPDGDHEYVYGVAPPAGVTVAAPFDPALHDTFVCEAILAVGNGLTVTTVAALVAVQRLPFICVTVYEPDVVNVAFLAVAPLLQTYDPAEFADDLKVTVPPAQKVVVLLGATELIEIVGVDGKALTVIIPVADILPVPPVKRMLYVKEPAAVGVPEIVIVLDNQVAETPAGKPLPPETPSFAIPVAPVVVCVIRLKRASLHTEPSGLTEDTVLSTGTRELCVVIPTALFALPKTPVEEILYKKLPLADALPEKDKALEAQVAPPLKSKNPTTSNTEFLKAVVLLERVLNRKDVKFFINSFFNKNLINQSIN